MCMPKSAIILKDSIFMPDYDSHTKMLEELGIEDTFQNAETKFVRAEYSPINGDIFTDMSEWKYHVDQDIVPDWYVEEYDKKRMYEALKLWLTTRNELYTNEKMIGLLEIGETFKIGNIEYVVLDKTKAKVSCVTKDVINSSKPFDINTNNFEESAIYTYLNGNYYDILAKLVGKENIVTHEIDLNSLDGLDNYDVINCKISLLTLDQYRKYRKVIPSIEYSYWLSTPWTPDTRNICCVYSGGRVCYGGCGGDFGVRPFCVFKSSILVSCK